MSLKQMITIITGIISSQFAVAIPPVEVIDSCKNLTAANSLVTMTKLIPPDGLGDDEPDCIDHYESKINNLHYGYITCNNQTSLIINGSRINLNKSVSHSINPSIKPEGDISLFSNWWKIEFNKIDYLCLDVPLSTSGDGANIYQYYIVENAYKSGTPTVHYYFFNKDVMPLTSME